MQIEHKSDGGVVTTITSVGGTDTESEIDLSSPNVHAMDRYYAELVLINKAMINKLSVDEADIKYLKVTQLESIEANIENAVIENLEGKFITVEEFDAEKARITVLEANSLTSDSAIITDLQAGVTKTNTLIFGSASGDTIQTSFSNSVIAQLGDAQIESAMIKEVSALKITGLDLNTSKLTIHSEDGLSYWKDNTIVIHDGVLGTPRIQIGKDGSGDYNMYVWNAQGKLMFDALGVTENGITRQIIRDDIVKEDANINASKLNIESLFSTINNDNTYTLKSSKILIDEENQTLDVSFKMMKSNIDGLQTTQTSQGTDIETIQGQISSKIWQQDITTAIDDVNEDITSLTTKYSLLEQDVGEFKTTVSETYTTIKDFNNLQIGGTNLFITSTSVDGYITTTGDIDGHLGFYTSDYIEIDSGQEYTLSRVEDTSISGAIVDAWRIAWYDKNKTYINRAAYTELIKTLKFVDTAKYIRVSAGKLSRIKVEKGNRATDWSPAPQDVDIKIDSATTIATQTADKFNWMVASGTSSSDFTLTDRMAELTAEIISFNGNVKVSGDMLVDGTITAEKLAVDAIKSRNVVWEGDDSGWVLIEGTMLDLQDGSFLSPNLSWDKYGNLVANNARFQSGSIGEWHIDTETNSLFTHVNYGGQYGVDYNVWMRAPVDKEDSSDFLSQWVFASAYNTPNSNDAYPYFYITTDGSAYFDDVVEVYDLKCTKFLSNWDAWEGGGLFTEKLVGSASAGTNYCFWIEPMRNDATTDTHALFGGYQSANTTTPNQYEELWYVNWDGNALFDTVSATQYNNVSDRNKKHDIVNLNEQQCINVICALNPVSFKFNNTEYQRNHWGFVAQDVESALENLNISWQDFAVVDKTLHKTETMPGEKVQNSEETYDYYLRYEAFIAPIVAVEQNHEKRIQQLENDLAIANAIIQSLLIQQSTV
jgi:hypothetical protein